MTRKNRGFAFVTMDSEKAARKALNYDGHKVMDRRDGRKDDERNRPLRVSLADPERYNQEKRSREVERSKPKRDYEEKYRR